MMNSRFVILDTSTEILQFKEVLKQLGLMEELFSEYDIVQLFFQERIAGITTELSWGCITDFIDDFGVIYTAHMPRFQLNMLVNALTVLFTSIITKLIHAKMYDEHQEMNYVFHCYCSNDLVLRKATAEDFIN
jgi:hypothetical protein